MSHKKCCKVHLTTENREKIIFPKEKRAFCNQVRSFPVGRRVCSRA